MNRLTRLSNLTMFLCALDGVVQATALSDVASGMQPGQWKELVTRNLSDTSDLLYGSGAHHSVQLLNATIYIQYNRKGNEK